MHGFKTHEQSYRFQIETYKIDKRQICSSLFGTKCIGLVIKVDSGFFNFMDEFTRTK